MIRTSLSHGRSLLPLLGICLLLSCNPSEDDRIRIGRPEGSGAAVVEPDDGPLTLMLWHAYRGAEEEALNAVIELFNEVHDDTTIETLAVPFDAYADRITAAIPRDRGPDMFIFAHDRVGDWSEEGIIEAINFWTNTDQLDLFFEQTVHPLIYRRRLFGLPLAFKSLVLYYNPDLIESPPRDTDTLIEMATALTEAGETPRYGLVYENTKLYFHAPWLHGFGAHVLTSDNVTVDSPEMAVSFEFAASLRRQHSIIPENVYSQAVTRLFNDGRAAMVINGPWFRGEIDDSVSWDVATLPIVSETGMPAAPFLTTEAIMISARSSHVERAFEASWWLATDPEATRIRLEVGHQPVALRSAFEDNDVDPVMAVFHEQMLNSVPTPNTPLMRRVWSHVDTALFKAIENGDDVLEVLSVAQERIENE